MAPRREIRVVHAALIWLWRVEGVRPDCWDIIMILSWVSQSRDVWARATRNPSAELTCENQLRTGNDEHHGKQTFDDSVRKTFRAEEGTARASEHGRENHRQSHGRE